MKHKLITLLVCILFAMGGTALADTTFYLTGAGVPDGNNLGGAYVAPYAGYLSPGIAPLGGGTLMVICDDYTHDVSLGDHWPVTVTQFSTGNLGNTRFGNGAYISSTQGLVLYQEVFYLINGMNFSSTAPSVLEQNADLNWAIWSLTYPAATGGTTLTLPTSISPSDATNIANDVMSAENNYTSENYSDFYIITPTCTPSEPCEAGTGQEYITKIPEPASLAIWAAGLSAWFFRRKRSSRLLKNSLRTN
jgi:hypothetical protein